METRGRKSSAALNVVPLVTGAERPPPPADLTEVEAEEWRAIVGRMPDRWFTRETHGLLAAYCRHWSNARLLAERLGEFQGVWLRSGDGLERFDRLSRVYDREVRAMSSLATRMRLTQQSRIEATTAATAARNAGVGGPKPWDPTG